MSVKVVSLEEFNLLSTKLSNLETAVTQLRLERNDLMDGFTELSISLADVAADVARLMANSSSTEPIPGEP